MREATGPAAHASRMTARRRQFRGVVVATLAAPVMAVLAPLGTDAITFWPRLLYWLILMEVGALLGAAATWAVHRWGRLAARPVVESALITLLIAVPLTLVVHAASGAFFDVRLDSLRGWAVMFGIVLMVSAVMVAIGHAIERRGGTAAPPAEQADPAGPLAERLPLPLRSLAIVALEAEDHYLRVHLEGGQSTLILMRLTDAIAALTALPGARTHRSWWVAKAAVTRIVKADGRAVLTLAGGLEAPVSRSHYRTLNADGWFV